MASEIQATYDTGEDLYVLIFNGAGQVWSTVASEFVAQVNANQADYDITLTEQGEDSGQYRGDWPDHANMIAGEYFVECWIAAALPPVRANDERVGVTGIMHWDGSAEITPNMMDTVLDTAAADVANLTIPNTWYVSKSGNDGNGGAAWGDAFLTIGAAVTAAISKDKIFVGPGTYTEAVTLGAKEVVIEGMDKHTCILTQAGVATTLTLGHNTALRQMTVSSTHAVGIGISTTLYDDITVEDCIVSGSACGFMGGDSERLTLRRCQIISDWYGADFAGAFDLQVEDCIFISTCLLVSGASACAVIYSTICASSSTFRRCWFAAKRTDVQDFDAIGINANGFVLLDNCIIIAEIANAGSSGNATGLTDVTADVSSILSVNSCKIISSSAGPGAIMDIVQTVAAIRLANTLYDAAKVTGTVTDIEASIDGRIGAFTGSGINTILGFLKALLSKVASAPSDVGGTFDPAADSVEAIRERGDSAWTSDIGTGAYLRSYTVTVNGNPLAECRVWITTDLAGATDPIADGYTNSNGVFTFRHNYAAGTTLYVWRQKSGYNFVNPDSEVI